MLSRLIVLVALLVGSCGPSDEERAAAQAMCEAFVDAYASKAAECLTSDTPEALYDDNAAAIEDAICGCEQAVDIRDPASFEGECLPYFAALACDDIDQSLDDADLEPDDDGFVDDSSLTVHPSCANQIVIEG